MGHTGWFAACSPMESARKEHSCARELQAAAHPPALRIAEHTNASWPVKRAAATANKQQHHCGRPFPVAAALTMVSCGSCVAQHGMSNMLRSSPGHALWLRAAERGVAAVCRGPHQRADHPSRLKSSCAARAAGTDQQRCWHRWQEQAQAAGSHPPTSHPAHLSSSTRMTRCRREK